MMTLTEALPARAARALFRHHVENGVAVSLTLGLVALGTGLWLGIGAAVVASIGAMCVSIVDQPGPLANKFRILASALLGSTLVTLMAGLASGRPWAMASVVALTSAGMALATAFGRPALMLGISGVLALVIGLAEPATNVAAAVSQTALFLLGATLYTTLALSGAALAEERNRRLALNEALLAFAAFLRARAQLYEVSVPSDRAFAEVIDQLCGLMEKLQAAREIIFTGNVKTRWAGGLIALLDSYESVLSSDADWVTLRDIGSRRALSQIAQLTRAMAGDVEMTALALVTPLADIPPDQSAQLLASLDGILAIEPDHGALLRPTRNKLARARDRARRLSEIVSNVGDVANVPQGVDVHAFLQPRLSVGGTLRAHATLGSPVARYAIRLVLAMLTGYGITLAIPKYVHGGWVLLTVALIMRASYAVTIQRRNDRILGTLAGCASAALLIPVLPTAAIVALIITGVGLAHAYGSVNYKVTSFAASTMALLLLHFLEPQTGFVVQRVVDTLAGAGLSMIFSFVLPSWERADVPRLVQSLLVAEQEYAEQALCMRPAEQAYRLARKKALDAFTALATLARRLSSEPRRRSGNLPALNALLAANYLLASDLASVQGFLHGRAQELDLVDTAELIAAVRRRVVESLARHPSGDTPVPSDLLRRRGWDEIAAVAPMVFLRRRLAHIEFSAERLSVQAAKACAHPCASRVGTGVSS